MRSTAPSSSGGGVPPSARPAIDRVGGALAQPRAVHVDAAHARLRGEGHEARRSCGGDHLVLAEPVLLGQHDDRAALGRLVGQRDELRGLGELGLGDAGHRDELRGLAVAERDRAGLVEQQHVDVARRLDRAAREREHVAAHEPVHAGDADRAQQRADRRRDQRDEQRDQRRDRDGGVGELRERAAASRRRSGRSASAPASRMFSAISFGVLRRSAPSTSAIMRSRNDWPGSWVISTTMRSESTRVPPVTALRSPPDSRMTGRGLAGDRRLVDRGDALDHRAVAGDHLAGLDDDDVAAVQLGGRARGAVLHAARRSRCASRAARRPGPCRGPRRAPRRGWRT